MTKTVQGFCVGGGGGGGAEWVVVEGDSNNWENVVGGKVRRNNLIFTVKNNVWNFFKAW